MCGRRRGGACGALVATHTPSRVSNLNTPRVVLSLIYSLLFIELEDCRHLQLQYPTRLGKGHWHLPAV
jgi:hypothetical protein